MVDGCVSKKCIFRKEKGLSDKDNPCPYVLSSHVDFIDVGLLFVDPLYELEKRVALVDLTID